MAFPKSLLTSVINISNMLEYKNQACDDEILVTKHQQRTNGNETNKKDDGEYNRK